MPATLRRARRLCRPGGRAPRPAGFTLIEMLTVVALLIIVLGLMVSLAWDVRRQSSERLTKDLLLKLHVLMSQYAEHHKRLPQISPLIETGVGESLTLPVVMVVDGESVTSVGLDKAGVTVEVLGATQGPKIVIQKYKNKTGYKKRQGHRQKYTQVKVTDISL